MSNISVSYHKNLSENFRMAVERDLEKSDALSHANIVFDYSGHFVIYPTMIGIKLVNIETNRCVKMIGKGDNLRPLNLALFQVTQANYISL